MEEMTKKERMMSKKTNCEKKKRVTRKTGAESHFEPGLGFNLNRKLVN